MFTNIMIGVLTIAGNVTIQIVGLMMLASFLLKFSKYLRSNSPNHKGLVVMIATVFGIFAIHTAQVWLWAAVFFIVGALPDFDVSLYYSTVTFSTLGYGDVTMEGEWRLFGALEGMNGFIMIGWSTAFLVSVYGRYGPFRKQGGENNAG